MNNAKFKAWDTEEKRWWPGIGGEWIDISSSGEVVHGFEDHVEEPDENRFIIRWFTGLLDKDETEIHQGDIVACFNFQDPRFRHEVVFQTGAWGYINHEQFIPFGANENFKWVKGMSKKIKVIGNIDENPELSEGRNESPG